MRTLARVGQRRFVTRHAQHGGRNADTNARLVHHVKHAMQALASGAHQVANGARRALRLEAPFTKVQECVGSAAPATFVVQAGKRHVVALARQFAVSAYHLLGHDEERNAASARHQLPIGPRDLGQHQMHDVFCQLVVTHRDPHLVAAQAIARAERVVLEMLAVGCGTGHHIRQARPGLRLAQAHGARPLTGKFARSKHLLLPLRAMHHQQVCVARGEQTRADADAGLGEKRIARRFNRVGQLHAAHGIVLRRTQHA